MIQAFFVIQCFLSEMFNLIACVKYLSTLKLGTPSVSECVHFLFLGREGKLPVLVCRKPDKRGNPFQVQQVIKYMFNYERVLFLMKKNIDSLIFIYLRHNIYMYIILSKNQKLNN